MLANSCNRFHRSGTRPCADLLLKHVAAQEAWTEIDLNPMRNHPVVARPKRWVEDCNELDYQMTEQLGFAGTAAALADIVAMLAWEPGVVRTVAGRSLAGRTDALWMGEPHGAGVTLH